VIRRQEPHVPAVLLFDANRTVDPNIFGGKQSRNPYVPSEDTGNARPDLTKILNGEVLILPLYVGTVNKPQNILLNFECIRAIFA
jgi:hypothetical protein